ncbi:hypothetical protein SDC9_122087 [bioreactor metagenome]|uniref:Uncharacterized protein n=1 Tax=bioreactor metagenome TaxID=1076179 RepID=A0A645CDN7_9ZZZZ
MTEVVEQQDLPARHRDGVEPAYLHTPAASGAEAVVRFRLEYGCRLLRCFRRQEQVTVRFFDIAIEQVDRAVGGFRQRQCDRGFPRSAFS